MIKIGDIVSKSLTSAIAEQYTGYKPKYTGKVVWIHPNGRFYVAEFDLGGLVVRECFEVPQ